MNILPINLRYLWRMTMRKPGFTLVIVFLIALGTSGIVATFNPIYSMIYAKLPFPYPEQLIRIGGDIPIFNGSTSSFVESNLLNTTFSSMTAYLPGRKDGIHVPNRGRYREVYSLLVTEDFLKTLGVKPLIGYDFKNIGDIDGIIISYRFWQNELFGASDIIGTDAIVNGKKIQIIGIMPNGFNFPVNVDVWRSGSGKTWPTNENTQFIGRLHTSSTLENSAKELRDAIFPSIRYAIKANGPILQSLHIFLYEDQRPLLWTLSASAILLLTLVCVSIINLFIAHGEQRKPEILLRLIFGASRCNIIYMLLFETLPLVLFGYLIGWGISEFVSVWLRTHLIIFQGGLPDVPVKVAFGAFIVVVVTLISGLIPALYSTSQDLNINLKNATSGKRHLFSTQELLVGLQLSITLALLISSGVLVRSLMFRVDFPIGWTPNEMVVVTAHANPDNIIQTERLDVRLISSFQDVQQKLKMLPEVINVGVLSPLPFTSDAVERSQMLGTAYKEPQKERFIIGGSGGINCLYAGADPDGFDVLGIPFIIGRHFTGEDVAKEIIIETTPLTIEYKGIGTTIVNQTLARNLWPGENVVGKIIYDHMRVPREIVGVVQDYHQIVHKYSILPTMYFPITVNFSRIEFLVRLNSLASMKRFQENVQLHLPVLTNRTFWFDVRSLNEHLSESMTNQQLTFQLMGCFSLLGMVLSALGIYSITTFMAESRKCETGIRMAMGAQVGDILMLALWRGLRPILVGLPLGLFLALVLTQALSNILFQVNAADSIVWIISCVLLIGTMIIAALIPALLAIRINPLDVLRNK